MRLLSILFALAAAPAIAQDADFGGDQYLSLCAGCHGMIAKGDGPMAALLSIAPTDLTQLSAANDGVFPMERVVRHVDGTINITPHGGPMPVFGPMLGGGSAVLDGPDGSVIETKGDVLAIALYLESIQAE